jgi:hypothetical protein
VKKRKFNNPGRLNNYPPGYALFLKSYSNPKKLLCSLPFCLPLYQLSSEILRGPNYTCTSYLHSAGCGVLRGMEPDALQPSLSAHPHRAIRPNHYWGQVQGSGRPISALLLSCTVELRYLGVSK